MGFRLATPGFEKGFQMANDATNHSLNSMDDMAVSADHEDTSSETVQLAEAPKDQAGPKVIPAAPNQTVKVDVSQGETVKGETIIRVAVANGETVVLPP